MDGVPTAIIGCGPVGRNMLVENAERPEDQQVNHSLIVEPGNAEFRGVDYVVRAVRHSLGNRDLKGTIEPHGNDAVMLNGRIIPVHVGTDIPTGRYRDLGIGTVMESTGLRLDAQSVQPHLDNSGVDVLIVTANATGMDNEIVGINATKNRTKKGNTSCTTKSCAGTVKALEKAFGIVSYSLVTTHAHTNPKRRVLVQRMETGVMPAEPDPEVDEFSVVPTGAGDGIEWVVPSVRGKLTSALAIRGPVINGSITALKVTLQQETTAEAVTEALRAFAQTHPNNLMFPEDVARVADGKMASNQFKDTRHVRSSKADAILMRVEGKGTEFTIILGYDNEQAPPRAANDLALTTEGRLAA